MLAAPTGSLFISGITLSVAASCSCGVLTAASVSSGALTGVTFKDSVCSGALLRALPGSSGSLSSSLWNISSVALVNVSSPVGLAFLSDGSSNFPRSLAVSGLSVSSSTLSPALVAASVQDVAISSVSAADVAAHTSALTTALAGSGRSTVACRSGLISVDAASGVAITLVSAVSIRSIGGPAVICITGSSGALILSVNATNAQATNVSDAIGGGGAVALLRVPAVRIDSCSFVNCSIAGAVGSVPGGGGLYLQPGSLGVVALSSLQFRQCSALDGEGGGALVTGGASVTAAGVQASSCSAAGGGAVAIVSALRAAVPSLTADACSAVGSARVGSGISALGGALLLRSVRFTALSNIAATGCVAAPDPSSGVTAGGDGGGVSASPLCGESCSIAATDVTLRDCAASGRGGGLFIDTGPQPKSSEPAVSVARLTASNCSAASGGGISLYRPPGAAGVAAFTLTDVNVTGCTASTGNGGGIAVPVAADAFSITTLALSNASISACSAALAGGGIHVRNSLVNLSSVAIIDCSTRRNGGGLHTTGSALDLSGVRLGRNSAAVHGGGASVEVCVSAVRVIAPGTAAAVSAGAASAAAALRFGLVAWGNAAAGRGGGLSIDSCRAVLIGVAAMNNNASEGGAIALAGSSDTLPTSMQLLLASRNVASGSATPSSHVGGGALRSSTVAAVDMCADDTLLPPSFGSWWNAYIAAAACATGDCSAAALAAAASPLTLPLGVAAANATCVLLSNAAPLGSGGDILVAPLGSGDPGTLTVARTATSSSSARVLGGSIALASSPGADIRSSAFLSSSCRGGLGGAIAVSRGDADIRIARCSFTFCSARDGGAVGATGSRPGAVLLSSSNFTSNAAAVGGGNIYAQAGPIPNCTACVSAVPSLALYGAFAASSSRQTGSAASSYFTAAGAGQSLVVVPNEAVSAPLLSLPLLDALGQPSLGDNGTACTLSVTKVSGASSSFAVLGFPTTYQAAFGVVTISPFSLLEAPGTTGTLSLACVTTEGLTLPAYSAAIATSTVSLSWSAVTMARLASASLLPSTSWAPVPLAQPIELEVRGSSGQLIITSSPLACSLAITSSIGPDGALGSYTVAPQLLAGAAAQTAAGVARFQPAASADANSTLLLSGTCNWLDGRAITTNTSVALQLAAIRPVWRLGPVSACADPRVAAAAANASQLAAACSAVASSAVVNSTATLVPLMSQAGSGAELWAAWSPSKQRWDILSTAVSAMGGAPLTFSSAYSGTLPFPGPAALPAALATPGGNAAQLQPLAPEIAILLLSSSAAGGAPALYHREGIACTLSAAAASTVASSPALASQRSNTVAAAVLAGELTAALVTGDGAVWQRVGLQQVPLGMFAALTATCMLPTRQPITSAPLGVSVYRLTATVLQPPPAAALPSGRTVASLLPLDPAPKVGLALSPAAGLAALHGTSAAASAALSGLPCSVAINASFAAASPAPELAGTTRFALGANGSVDLSGLGIVATFGSSVALDVTCTWLSGETVTITLPAVQLVHSRLSWGAAAALGNGSSSGGSSQCARPIPLALHNTPLPAFGALTQFARLSTPSGSPTGAWDSDWTSLGLAPGDIRCSLTVTAPPGTAVLLSGPEQADVDGRGAACFAGVALQLVSSSTALSSSNSTGVGDGSALSLCAACTLRGSLALTPSPICAPVLLQSMRLLWAPGSGIAPALLPTAQSRFTPLSPAPTVWLVNGSGALLDSESDGSCTISLAADAQSAASGALLLGDTRAALQGGVGRFSTLGISAPLGSAFDLVASCARKAGGAITPATASTSMDTVAVRLLNATAGGQELRLLHNTAVRVVGRVDRGPRGGPLVPAAGLLCSARVRAINGTAAVALEADSLTTVDASGFVVMRVLIAGDASDPSWTAGALYISCAVADLTAVSDEALFRLERVEGSWAVPPPDVWLPSSGTARTAVSPAPALLLRTGSGAAVSVSGVSCKARVEVGDGAVKEAPDDGWIALLAVADAPSAVDGLIGVAISAGGGMTSGSSTSSSSSSVAVLPSVNASLARLPEFTTPIAFSGLLLSGSWGAVLDVRIRCTRKQGDVVALPLWRVRLVQGALRWAAPPPLMVASQRPLSATVELLDNSSSSSAPRSSSAGSSLSSPSTSFSIVRATLDRVSTCSLALLTNDTKVVVQGGVGTAAAGIVNMSASVAARSGMSFRGTATCLLGEQPWPGPPLDFSLTIEPCAAGEAPSGYTCERCGSGSYSDGGPSALLCETCPREGVQCAGGLLTLLPGFFRADAGASIDATTELHPCAFPNGCFVNTTSVSRAAQDTHSCNAGYSGPLCGVCDPTPIGAEGEIPGYARSGSGCSPCWKPAASAAIVALLPLAVVAFASYVSLTRQGAETASSPTKVVLRIAMTYVQTLGTLGALFVAKGTAAFRDIFGLAAAVGDSPFALAPVECTLRPTAYARFAVTVSLPFIITGLGLAISVAVAAGKVMCGRQGQEQAAPATAALTAGDAVAITASAGGLNQDGGTLGSARAPPASPSATSAGNAAGNAAGNVAVRAQGARAAAGAAVRAYFATSAYLPIVIFVLNLGYASVTTASFNILNCRPRPVAGVRYLVGDLSVACGTPAHTVASVVAGIVIFAYGLGIPVLFACILRRNRASLREPRVRSLYGFLYDGYRLPEAASDAPAQAQTTQLLPSSASSSSSAEAADSSGTISMSSPLASLAPATSDSEGAVSPLARTAAGSSKAAAAAAASKKRSRLFTVPAYAWESVVLVRKATVVMIGALLARDGYMQAAAAVLVLALALFLQASAQPYAIPLFNWLDGIGLYGLIATVVISVFYLRVQDMLADCANAPPDADVAAFGTNCAALQAGADGRDKGITFLLVAINFAVVIAFLLAYIGFTVAENAAAAEAAAAAGGQGSAAASTSRCLAIMRRFPWLQAAFPVDAPPPAAPSTTRRFSRRLRGMSFARALPSLSRKGSGSGTTKGSGPAEAQAPHAAGTKSTKRAGGGGLTGSGGVGTRCSMDAAAAEDKASVAPASLVSSSRTVTAARGQRHGHGEQRTPQSHVPTPVASSSDFVGPGPTRPFTSGGTSKPASTAAHSSTFSAAATSGSDWMEAENPLASAAPARLQKRKSVMMVLPADADAEAESGASASAAAASLSASTTGRRGSAERDALSDSRDASAEGDAVGGLQTAGRGRWEPRRVVAAP